MKFYLIDDDPNILHILKKIISDRRIGEVIGVCGSGEDALDDLRHLVPDVVVVDLLMPDMDGVTFLKKAAPFFPDTAFVMLSQVSSKDMIASAYKSGAEFYIQKPINSIEVEAVLRNVTRDLDARRTISRVQGLFRASDRVDPRRRAPAGTAENGSSAGSSIGEDPYLTKAKTILRSLGILGEKGSADILLMLKYLHAQGESASALSLREICSEISDSPKSVEQRVRRAATTGLVNLANLGLEDYSNDTFNEYSNTLYNFEQVRAEMDFIRGKGHQRGNVRIRVFLNALYSYCHTI